MNAQETRQKLESNWIQGQKKEEPEFEYAVATEPKRERTNSVKMIADKFESNKKLKTGVEKRN